jgi:hypothetical protein
MWTAKESCKQWKNLVEEKRLLPLRLPEWNRAGKIFEQLDKKLEEIKAFEGKLIEALATDKE